MNPLDRPINKLPKVGDKYKFLFSKLDIFTIRDLIYHFPFRYEDYSKISTINETLDGQFVTVKATVLDVKNIFSRYGKKLTKAKVTDPTGSMELLWMNQMYVANNLSIGGTFFFSGKISLYKNKKTMFSPEFERVGGENLNTGRLVPVYPETAGVSSKYIRARINDVLTQNLLDNFIEDQIDPDIKKRQELINLIDALNKIHFPKSIEDTEDARKRFSFEELYSELLNVEIRKAEWNNAFKSRCMVVKTDMMQGLEGSLPFELTASQKQAISEISGDLTLEKPMNRLLEGDVGTGKTIVAIFASYIAHLNNFLTIYLAPTEILAEQHYKTFKKILPNVEINLLTGTKKLTNTENPNIIIGTHALLYNEQIYKNVGLIIIDEQHRFGVEQRAKIIKMAQTSKDLKPHLLSMTATPIPRTLALTLYGDLDISVLTSPPNKYKKITTKVVPQTSREKVYEWIKNKKESTFIVCPLIEESESESFENVKSAQKEFELLSNTIFKGIPVGLLHGKMKSQEKQEIIDKFRNGEIKILISTPVIEVGVDIPDAVVMVIESAERYGLASLHQLRGRVGRGEKEGYCFVFMTENSRGNYQRLKNLEEITDGLKLAEVDLKYRGTGDIYGTLQHGFKKFKIADLTNLELVEKAKVEAQNTIKSKSLEEIKKYSYETGKLIEKN